MTNARSRLSVVPLGSVPFDGQTIPVVSPDGRFIAAQVGPPPSWSEQLCGPASDPGILGQRSVQVFRVSEPTRSGAAAAPLLVPMPPIPSTRGLTLGSSADAAGVLVERHEQDASRTLGVLDWQSGQIDWIPSQGAVNFRGTFLPSSAARERRVAFIRAQPAEGTASIVVRSLSGEGQERVFAQPAVAPLCLLATHDPTTLYAVALERNQDGAARTRAWRLLSLDVSDAAIRVRFIATLDDVADVAEAHQAASPMQTPWPVNAGAGLLPDGVALFSPRQRRVLWMSGSDVVQTLASASAVAVPLLDPKEPALAVATDRMLALQLRAAADSTADPTAPNRGSVWQSGIVPVLPAAVVPRAVSRDGSGALVVFEPPQNGDGNSWLVQLIQPAKTTLSDSEKGRMSLPE